MTPSPDNFEYLRKLIRDQSAIVLDSEKAYLAETRLLSLAAREGYTSVNSLLASLRTQPHGSLHAQTVEAMTNNETSFFRDLLPFEDLRRFVVPELVEARSSQRSLNIWSAACSSGQEPYSILLLLLEHFPFLSGWNLRIFASDLSATMLERTRAGRYGQLEVNRGLPAALLVKYFERVGLDWQISERIRRLLELHRVNLASDNWPTLPKMDVILLRNVLIYFDVETKKRILGRVRRLLRPDGYLFLGGAETTLHLDDAFERITFGRSGCYRLRGAAAPLAVRPSTQVLVDR